jgi:tripartite-type tricarboxylate transporter receptor subunit TctC
VAQEASAILGTPIVVENKAGAGGMIAGDFVVRSKPDGKTFFVGANAPLVLNMGLYAKMPYDPEKDLIPVAGLGKSPLLLVTRKDLGVVSLKELLALAKKTPGKLTMGSAGSGNITHVGGEFVNSKMMGGHVDIMFDALPSSMQHAKAGKIQAIAIVDTQRFAQLPDVPTLVESGFPVAEASAWIVLMAPAQTPAAVVEEMNRAVNTALKKPDVIEKLQGIGEQPMPGTAQDLGKFIASERSRWIPLIKTLGLKAD